MRRAELLPYAERIRDLLAPACERICIAGGLRRGKPDPHDIEIVALPILAADLFGGETFDYPDLSARLRELLDDGLLCGDGKNGPRYKRFQVREAGVPLDLFLADRDNYGNTLAIRTGDWEFSKWMVTERRYGGGMPEGLKQRDGYLWYTPPGVDPEFGPAKPAIVPCPTEKEFCRSLGLPVLPPNERNAAGIAKLKKALGIDRRG